jgi:hypothetical protein
MLCSHQYLSSALYFTYKEIQFLLGTQTCLGSPWLATRFLGTQIDFFGPTIDAPMNLALIPLAPLVC